MNSAENTAPSSGAEGLPPAGGQELSIPKHRFDEVNNELKRFREEQTIKDQLYLQERQRLMQSLQPQPAQAPEITAEETGLDPQLHAAVLKAARAISGREIAQAKSQIAQQFGILANRTEKAEFLASHGADKAKYYQEIQRRQQQHYQETGGYMPSDLVYKLIRADELEARFAREQGQPPAQGSPQAPAFQPQAPAQPAYQGVPNAAATRQMPTSGSPGNQAAAPQSFSAGSLEEMEARLEEQFRAGNTL